MVSAHMLKMMEMEEANKKTNRQIAKDNETKALDILTGKTPAPKPKTPARPSVPELKAKVEEVISKSSKPKKLLTLRLSEEAIEGFKAKGKGWQAEIDHVLRRHLGL